MADDLRIKVLGFFTKYVKNPETGKRDKPIDYVRFSPAQALNTQITEERVSALRPDGDDPDDDQPNRALKRMYMTAMWSSIGPAYDAWKAGYAIPENGTPLGAWAGITRDQADALRKAGILTVEDLASLDDNKFNRIPMPNAREVRDLARRYLATGDATQTADRLNDLEDANRKLSEQLQAAMELLEEQAKPKRGRPRKDDADDEAA